jgi:hypothetical protein
MGSGTQIATRRDEHRDTAAVACTRDDDARMFDRLGDVSTVGDDDVERSPLPVPNDADGPQLEPTHDLARRPHDHDDAQPQPDGDASLRKPVCAQEDERVVVAGLRASRELRRHDE